MFVDISLRLPTGMADLGPEMIAVSGVGNPSGVAMPSVIAALAIRLGRVAPQGRVSVSEREMVIW